MTPLEIRQALQKTLLPRLWMPKVEAIHRIESLPLLGTGKLDLRGVKKVAEMKMEESARALVGG